MPPIGGMGDVVRLTVAGQELKVWKKYEIRSSVLNQPAVFTLTLGDRAIARELMAAMPPRSLFELRINEQLLHTGRLEGPALSDSAGTELVIKGRDHLAPLHDDFVRADRTFDGVTPKQLVEAALKEVGLRDAVLSTRSNSRATKPLPSPGSVKAGGRWYEYITKQLNRVGLFLWCEPDGTFVLSEPDSSQAPSYRCIRRGELGENDTNVKLIRYENDTSRRFAEYVVAGRGGIPKSGLIKGRGAWVDEEMKNLGYEKTRVIHDTACKSQADAEYLARRIAAETNRAACPLQYRASGHTTPGLRGGRLAWVPDTTASVEDEGIGLVRTMYIESCTYTRGPDGTWTILTLMRPEHMIFATDRDET